MNKHNCQKLANFTGPVKISTLTTTQTPGSDAIFLGDLNVWKRLPGVLYVTLDVFADDGLLVLASHVMPLDAVAVEVVEHGHARFGVAAVLDLLTVVRLNPRRIESGMIQFW